MDGVARIWDIDGGRCIECRGHELTIHLVAFCPTQPILLTASWDGTVSPLERRYGKADLCLPGQRKAHISRQHQLARGSGGYRLLVERPGAHLESRRREAFARIPNPQETRLPHLLPRSGRTTGGHCILGRHRARLGRRGKVRGREGELSLRPRSDVSRVLQSRRT